MSGAMHAGEAHAPTPPHAHILATLERALRRGDTRQIAALHALVEGAGRVFVAGAGRSALVARFFAMRLMHCGHTVYVVGETVTPAIAADDVLVIVSGSGATATLVPIARRAAELGASIALISAHVESPLAALATQLCQVVLEPHLPRGMPLGTAFELAALIQLEALVYRLVETRDLSAASLRARHANLE